MCSRYEGQPGVGLNGAWLASNLAVAGAVSEAAELAGVLPSFAALGPVES
jgi:hypothetical protein